MCTGGEVTYHTSVVNEEGRLTLAHLDERTYWLKPGMAVESDTHHVELVHGGLREALAAYRQMAQRTMPLQVNPPAWTRQAIILEAYPQYYKDGFRGLTARLPFYREVGFNTIYLMPHWLGGYSPIDLYQVNPKLGTQEDLQGMVRKAHELGMKVLFDMVIHGFNEKSPVVQQRPEIFVHDEAGQPARHPTWKSITTDWASPAYQQYMVDLVLHDLRTYDIDGYRVDAATYKGPNWDPRLAYPAYRSGSAAPELIGKMLSAMRHSKSDATMLSEVFGPLFYSVCDLVHDNQTESPQFFIEQMDKGLLTAAHYRDHMAAVLDALPPGATRVMFARNHDTSWFYHFNGYSNRFLALDAVHVLFAVPEAFSGDPGHKPNPDDDPAVWEFYRKLFALRKQFPALATGQVLLHEVQCDNPNVFAGVRQLEGKRVIGIVSFSDVPERVTLRIDKASSAHLLDAITGEKTELKAADGELRIEVKPWQILAGPID